MVTAVSQKRGNRYPPAVALDGRPERFYYRRSRCAAGQYIGEARLRTDAFQLGGGHHGRDGPRRRSATFLTQAHAFYERTPFSAPMTRGKGPEFCFTVSM